MNLSALFSFVLSNYHEFYNSNSKPSEHVVAQTIKKEIPELLMTLLDLNNSKYSIVGSYGLGNKTRTPWISIFDQEITEGAQKGFYVVYLFREDMSGFYLSLNQGTTYLAKKFKGKHPRQKMQEVAEKLRQELAFCYSDFSSTTINLMSQTINAKNYQSANIYSKFYQLNDPFTSDQMIQDASTLLEGLKEVKKFVGSRDLDVVIDDLLYKDELADTKYQEDILISSPCHIEEKPQPITKMMNKKTSEVWKRDPSIAKTALMNVNYVCEVDSSHSTFTSAITNQNFTEAHHLVPMSAQNEFEVSLDVPGNIVSLCPNCHRKIHHAVDKEKVKIIKSLILLKKKRLQKYGIYINDNKLLNLYGVKNEESNQKK